MNKGGHRLPLEGVIQQLYAAFSSYDVTDFSSLGMYDPRPSPDVLAMLSSHSLREIPEDAIWQMKFYSAGWVTPRDEAEVKHFLPRILELLATHFDRLGWPGTFSLFKYKLHGAMQSWPDAECDALRAWASAVVDFHLHRRWDFDFIHTCPNLVGAALEMGIPGEELLGALSNIDAALALNRTDDGQQILLLDTPTYCEDESVLREFDVAREGLVQRQLDAIDDTDEVWVVIDQLPEDAIPPETRRRLFRQEVARFRRWAAAQTSLDGDWKTGYSDWSALKLAAERLFSLPGVLAEQEVLGLFPENQADQAARRLLQDLPTSGITPDPSATE